MNQYNRIEQKNIIILRIEQVKYGSVQPHDDKSRARIWSELNFTDQSTNHTIKRTFPLAEVVYNTSK